MNLCEVNTYDSGLRDSSFSNDLRNSGRVYKGIDLAPLLDGTVEKPLSEALAEARHLGVTDGGSSISYEPEYREINWDGKRGSTVGGTEVVASNVTLGVNLKEFDLENLSYAFPQTQVNTPGNGYTELLIKECITYHSNFAWIGTHGNRKLPFIAVVLNAMNSSPVTANFQDRAEATLAMSLKGNYTAGVNDVPMKLFLADENVFTGILSATDVTLASNAGTVDLTIGAINSFDDDIKVSLAGQDGITIANEPVTISAPYTGPTSLAINADGVAAGSYQTYVVATVAARNLTQTFPLTVIIP